MFVAEQNGLKPLAVLWHLELLGCSSHEVSQLCSRRDGAVGLRIKCERQKNPAQEQRHSEAQAHPRCGLRFPHQVTLHTVHFSDGFNQEKYPHIQTESGTQEFQFSGLLLLILPSTGSGFPSMDAIKAQPLKLQPDLGLLFKLAFFSFHFWTEGSKKKEIGEMRAQAPAKRKEQA